MFRKHMTETQLEQSCDGSLKYTIKIVYKEK